MVELSSNWKRLQSAIKAEGASKRPEEQRPGNPASRSGKTSRATTAKAAVRPASARPHKICKNRRTSRPRMGGVQSSSVESGPKDGPSPSIALWTSDKEISTEALADAYGLGIKDNSMLLASQQDRVNQGLGGSLSSIGKYVAIDCEMVGVGPGGHESVLARVSMVDFHGRQVYDSFVKPREKVTDWRTAVSGVSQKEMRFARDFDDVQQDVFNVLKDRIVVGHDIKHDLDALQLSHPLRDIRDTVKHATFRKVGNGRKPALKTLARELLGVDIQDGSHSSIEDARVTMLLFRRYKPGFDVDHANRYAPKPATNNSKHVRRSKDTKTR
ncbi:RNA exonuclease 4 [Drechmeria coniospora]|uniref:RNA exonuclease 4 n=1 Tax=Drechmeria coniospora TaxID=98403 RepID=A0A151GY02_DRECN|nr:RNA exonuclease 4 [Drechmeria coniospora]KYK61988.1 RNA exonuclease 4 [Drechmeria coniospora]